MSHLFTINNNQKSWEGLGIIFQNAFFIMFSLNNDFKAQTRC